MHLYTKINKPNGEIHIQGYSRFTLRDRGY